MNDCFAFVGPVRTEDKSKRFQARSGILRRYSLVLFWLSVAAGLCPADFSVFRLAEPSAMIFAAAVPDEQADAKTQVEYQLKAAFLFNFIKFVEWPEKPAQDSKADESLLEPFRIGIIGQDPFGKAFEGVQDKTIRNRKLEIVRLEGLSSFRKKNETNAEWLRDYIEKYQKRIQSCSVLFVCESEKKFCKEAMEVIGETTSLIVSDIENIAERGGVIGFVNEDNKVRFDINMPEAQKRKLKICSQLLRLARKVKKADGQG